MSPVRMGKIESASRTALALYQALNEGDLDAVMALIDPAGRIEAADGEVHADPAAVRAYFAGRIESAHGARFAIEDLKGLGKTCILYWKIAREGSDRRGVDILLVEDTFIQSIHTYVKE